MTIPVGEGEVSEEHRLRWRNEIVVDGRGAVDRWTRSRTCRLLSPARLAGRLARARRQFDLGVGLGHLVAGLPNLIATAQQAVQDAGTPDAYALLAGCYGLATEALDKVGGYAAGRITADRAVSTAALSGSPISMAAAARALALVLRRARTARFARDPAQYATGRRTTQQTGERHGSIN
jgi:hypothetical protein